ncbi:MULTISPECIES: hypothetical protein [Planktothricoides]|uniref:Uncharacterized protein n=2 Tax=Planktothricoides raciborskii TaxID=132608 RepID=A0AAU8J714_9CYAN|nr:MULTISPECIES: hypothetical protein [Planktothricoides]MBD2546401.1 hypothetical protein [Planktothricoides raciborskii FACHB-1370]MBD2584799.1 hypothetical protein [Planktothricoides raciborskii FACHB-1261]
MTNPRRRNFPSLSQKSGFLTRFISRDCRKNYIYALFKSPANSLQLPQGIEGDLQLIDIMSA